MSSLVRNITHSAKPLLRAATLTTPRTSPFICLRTSTSAYYNAVASSKRFSTTNTQRAELATSLPSKPTVLVSAPVQETLDEEEIDVEFIPPEKANLVITDRAAEQLRNIATRNQNPDAALRISVESGGCHGYQYKMELSKHDSPDDYHFSHPTLKPSNILIDAVSLSLVNGSVVDFATELIGSSFRILDNPQAKGSGCGCGVSWELKD